MTKEMVASFFEVDIRTIERYISANAEELKQNGYELLRGRELKAFLRCYDEHFGTDIYVGTKTTVLGVFDFRAFLDIAMLLSESEKARAIRQCSLSRRRSEIIKVDDLELDDLFNFRYLKL